MPKSKDKEREHRILYEVIVDAYGEEEQLMGWFYYFQDNLEFPIKATVRFRLRGGGEEIKKVKIVEVNTKNKNEWTIRLGIVEGKSERIQTISPEEIKSIDTSPENLEIINDWLYWHDFDLLPA